MKLQDTGAFFCKDKDDSIWFLIYIKTNTILKKHPDAKLYNFDTKTKTVVEKSHTPNRIWFILFDKNKTDYVSNKDYTTTEFNKIINEYKEYYDYREYTAKELYNKMKESGLKKVS